MTIRVLHVLNYSLPNISGYTIRSKYLIESEKALGLAPYVITSPKYDHENPYRPVAVISGIEYHRTKRSVRPLRAPFVNEAFFIKDFREKIKRVAEKLGIDVIHAHSPSLNGLAGLKLKIRGQRVPLVYQVRALWEDAGVESGKMKAGSLKYRSSRYMESILLDRADYIVVICKGLKDILTERGVDGDKIEIVENGVDTDIFSPRERNERLVEKYELAGRCVVGFIGSFFRFEGVHELVKAFAVAARQGPPLKMMLIGSGEEFDHIRSLVEELGLEDDVILRGAVPHDEILDYYSVIDILVYPRVSTRLTEFVTPLKPLEGMAMGKTVVGSDVGGLRELIEDGETGLLYPAGNTKWLARTIMDLAEDSRLRSTLGKAASEHTSLCRNWLSITSKMPGIYEKVLKNYR